MSTNSDFLVPISSDSDVVNLCNFKQWLVLDQKILVWNIKGLRYWVPKILGLENQSLWQRVNSFPYILLHFRNYQHNSLHFITFQRASAHFLTFYRILVNISIVFKNDFSVVKNETIVLRTSFSFKWKSDCTFS